MRPYTAPLALAVVIFSTAGVTEAQSPGARFEHIAEQGSLGLGTDAPDESTPISRPSKDKTSLDRHLVALREKSGQPQASASILVQLGDVLMQESRNSTDGRLYDEAEMAYIRALAAEPDHVDAMIGFAWVCNSRHDFVTGKIWAEKALAINPLLSRAHALLGDAAVEYGAYDDAFKHYQDAIDIRPDLSSYSRAAHLMWLTGDAAKARWLMEKAIATGGPHPENTAWCRAQLALMSFETGALVAAEQQAQAAVKQAPNNPHVLAVAGRIKTAKKEYDAAIDFYRRAIAVAPGHDALVALGDLYALTGRSAEAADQYRRVVDLHRPGATHSHGGFAHTHSPGFGNIQLARFFADHDRDLEEALKEARMGYQNFPNILAADTLAWCYYKAGRYDEADSALQAALRWNTPDAAILFHAGMITAKRGDRVSAAKFLYRALNLNPYFHPMQADVAAAELKLLAAQPSSRSLTPSSDDPRIKPSQREGKTPQAP